MSFRSWRGDQREPLFPNVVNAALTLFHYLWREASARRAAGKFAMRRMNVKGADSPRMFGDRFSRSTRMGKPPLLETWPRSRD
jgi:hypothetical protein